MSAPLRHTVLRSASKEVVLGADRPFCVIGERINPTGRPVFQAALREGDLSIVAKPGKYKEDGELNKLTGGPNTFRMIFRKGQTGWRLLDVQDET